MLTYDIPYNASAIFHNTNGNRNSSEAGGGESLFETLTIGNDVGNLPITATGANPFQVNAGIGGSYFNHPSGGHTVIASAVTMNASTGHVFNDESGFPNLNIDCTATAKHYFWGNGGAGCKLGINNDNPAFALDVTGEGNFTSDITTGGDINVSDGFSLYCGVASFITLDDGAKIVSLNASGGTIEMGSSAITVNGSTGVNESLAAAIAAGDRFIVNGLICAP